jgi:hypothetical protein
MISAFIFHLQKGHTMTKTDRIRNAELEPRILGFLAATPWKRVKLADLPPVTETTVEIESSSLKRDVVRVGGKIVGHLLYAAESYDAPGTLVLKPGVTLPPRLQKYLEEYAAD